MLSEDVRTILELFRYHAPLEKLQALPVILASAVAGMVMSLGGARSVQTLVTALAGILGAILGTWLSLRTPLPAWLCVTVGTFGLGYLGCMGYRVWVGFGSALMLSALVLSVYIGHTVLPYHHDYIGVSSQSRVGGLSWTVPSAGQVRARSQTPYQYFSDFRRYFAKREPDYVLHLSLMLVPAAVAGLVFGTLAPRLSSIVWTSLVGSIFLIIAGVTMLITMYPDMAESFILNAQWVGWLLLFVTVLSIYFQTSTSTKKKSSSSSGGSGGGGSGGGSK